MSGNISSNEEILYTFTFKFISYYFTRSHIIIEKNEAIENAAKNEDWLFNLVVELTAQPKAYQSVYYHTIERIKLVNFGVIIYLNSGKIEELRFSSDQDARDMHRFIDYKIKENGRPNVINYGQYVGKIIGNATNVAGNAEDIAPVAIINTADQFTAEVSEAIKRINEIEDLQQTQKEELSSIIQNAAKANEEKDENKKQSCVNSFKKFLRGIGNVSDKVLSTLANLATICGFFGIVTGIK